jgi:PAS domain S-box-containing protein/diguanylate cyclase (GGDEF)-like protein
MASTPPGSSPDLRLAVVDQALRDAALHKALLDQLEAGIYMVDRERRILYWNAAAERISGYMAHEVAGHFCHGDLLMHCDGEGTVLCGKGCPLAGVMGDGRPRECTVFLRHRQGHRVPVRVRSRAIYDSSGGVIGAVEVFEEAIAARDGIRALQPFGCLDELTGAVTRKYGEMRVRQSLEALNLFEIPFGWMRVGLDNREDLEHRYGYGMIDAAVRMVGATLDRNLGSLDLLTRWTRTEFRIEIDHCGRMDLGEIADRLLTLVRASGLEWWGDRLSLSVSIAAANAEHGDTLESLEARVAEAFESSRASGGNRAAINPAGRARRSEAPCS